MNKEKQIFDEYGNYDFPTDIKQKGLNTATSQIIEMAKIAYKSINEDCLENNMGSCEDCKYDCHRKENDEYDCQFYAVAERLYNAGYRKVGDDEIVLSFEQTQEYRQAVAKVKFMKDKIRKETAKEILRDFLNYIAMWGVVTRSDILKKADEYGVEVEE